MLIKLQEKSKTPISIFFTLYYGLITAKERLLPFFMMALFLFSNNTNAQIVVTHKEQAIATGTSITLNYTVPVGTDRLLIVSAGSEIAPTSVTFGGAAMTQVGTTGLGTLWTMVQGTDLVTPTTGDIVFTVGSSAQYIGINAISFSGVDQGTPVNGFDDTTIAGSATSSSLPIVSKAGDMVLDGIFAGCLACFIAAPTVTEGAGQTEQNTTSIVGAFGGRSATSTKAGAASVSMEWTITGTAVASGIHSGINIVAVGSLPIELSFFSAQSQREKVLLSWETLSELNNEGFEVQRSTDGTTFEKLIMIAGKGTTSSVQRYAFTDEFPPKGKIYYRLKQLDYDGAFEYSNMETAEIEANERQLKILPNPAVQGMTSLYFAKAPNVEALLEVFDFAGQRVYQRSISLDGDAETVLPLDLSGLAAGVYLVRMEIGGELLLEKLILE